jgi:hypothetical protein
MGYEPDVTDADGNRGMKYISSGKLITILSKFPSKTHIGENKVTGNLVVFFPSKGRRDYWEYAGWISLMDEEFHDIR